MTDFFNHRSFVEQLKSEIGIDDVTEQKIREKYVCYGNPQNIFAIPIMISTRPTPYSPIRINRRTMTIYVPNKQRLVTEIRNLIIKEIGVTNFTNGFFPIYSETVLKTHLYFPTPQNFSKEQKYLAEEKVLRPIVTPDCDNIEKIIFDSIKDFIVYDDAQLTTTITEKYYSQWPRIEVVIFYNRDPLSVVHQPMMDDRKEKWNKKLFSENPPKMLNILRNQQ